VQFAPPNAWDPPNYQKLWAVTSAPGAANGIKPALQPFVQAAK
jgi:hypothetical protein